MLTRKQQIFVDEYLRTSNGTQAAIAAGYSRKSARAIASENLKKPEIFVAVENRAAEKRVQFDSMQQKLLSEIESIAFAKIPTVLLTNAMVPRRSTRDRRALNAAIRLKLKALNMWANYQKEYLGSDE
jgi:phage terminase small subunit